MPWSIRSVLVTVVILVTTAPAARGADVVSLKLPPSAQLVDDGAAALVTVRARCAPGVRVLEAFVYVVQDGATSQFAFFSPRCDGKQHRFVVRVNAFDESPFHEGPARLSGYILESSPEGAADSPTRLIRLHT